MALQPRPESRDRNRIVSEIADFTPGIYSDIYGGFSSSAGSALISRNGAATIDSTFRCVADPVTGALGPLPRGQDGYSKTLIPGNANNTNAYYPNNIPIGDYLLDMVIGGHMKSTTLADDMVVVFYGAHISASGSGPGTVYNPYIIGTRILPANATSNDISFRKGSTQVSIGTIPSAQVVTTRHLPSGTNPTTAVLSDFVPSIIHTASNINATWATGALSATEQGWTDYDTNVSANYEDAAADGNNAWMYPNAKNTNSHVRLGFKSGGFLLEAHQGRGVIGGWSLNQMDASTLHVVEFITYTPVYTLMDTGNYFYAPVDPPSAFTAMGSMNADELFLIKAFGGAVLIRGDLNGDFQIIKLPFVESTEGTHSHGVTSPLGFCYISRRGVFAWNGGDTSEFLSPQLDGNFWEISSAYIGSIGRLAWKYPFLYVPNSFIFDSRSKSWWRLEDTTAITPQNCFAASGQSERVYGGKYIKTAADNVLYRFYDPTSLAYTYSWKSQPLLESNEYRLEVREIELIAQPHASSSSSTVTVTISAFQEDGGVVTPVAVTFTLDATNKRPQRLRANLSISGVSMQVTITADGSSAPAPKVYGPLRLIGQEIARSPKTN